MGAAGSHSSAEGDQSHHALTDECAGEGEDLKTRLETGLAPDGRPGEDVRILSVSATDAVAARRQGRLLAAGSVLAVGGLTLLLVLILTPHKQVQLPAELEYMELADTALRLAPAAKRQHARREMAEDPPLLRKMSRGQRAHNLKELPSLIRSDLHHFKEKQKDKEARRWEEGICFINALIASEKLALAGLQLEDSVAKCRPAQRPGFAQDPATAVQTACAADITGVYASFMAAGSYLAGIAAACPEHVSTKDAACAQDQLDIQYGLGTIASALSNFKGACSTASLSTAKPIPEGRRNTVTGLCVVNVAQAAAYIGHAVTSVHTSATDCDNIMSSSDHASCSAQVSGLLQSFFLIMAYLSNAAELCGHTLVAGAACSSHVESLLAGFMEVSAGASASANDCGLQENEMSTRPR